MIPRLGDGNEKYGDLVALLAATFFMIPRLGDGNLETSS